jgi:opacity protein-like surface antigen
VTSLGLALAPPATSEPIPKGNDPAQALAQVTPGVPVRIEDRAGRVLEGRYVTTTDGDVVLDEPAMRIPAASIRKVWVRGRATTTGAVIGGIVVGLSSALLGAAAGAFCESDCRDGVVYEYAGIGFVIGAGLGTLTGGLIGASFPKWHRLNPGRSPTAKPGGGVTPGRIGALSFQGGPALGRDPNSGSGGFGGHLGLAAQLPGGLAPGLEFGRFGLGHGSVPSPRGRALNFNESVSHFGFSLTKSRDHGRLRPYGLAGLGRYSWRGFNSFALNPDFEIVNSEIHRSFFGASVGGGAHWRLQRSLSFETEGRWHTSLGRVAQPTLDGPAQHWNMVSLTAGARFLW